MTMLTRKCVIWTACTLLLAMPTLFAGCMGDRGPERVAVNGRVTYNGKPIPEGLIRFVPAEASSAPVSGAAIMDGNYKVDSRGGVPVGRHRIEIEAHRPSKAGAANGAAGMRSPAFAGNQYIPEKYNVKTRLEITIQSGSPEITKDLDLTD